MQNELNLQSLHKGDYVDIKVADEHNEKWNMKEFAIGLITNIENKHFMTIKLQPSGWPFNKITEFHLKQIDIKNGQIPSNITIKPLNTHTTYHHYIFNKLFPKCKMYSWSTSTRNCSQCQGKFCEDCSLLNSNNNYLCINCTSLIEKQKIYKILQQVKPNLFNNIYNCIAEYCITVIILNCSNCKKEVIFNTILDYKFAMEYRNYDKCLLYTISSFYKNSPHLFVNKTFDYDCGEYIYQRIICNECKKFTKECELHTCYRPEVQFDVARDLEFEWNSWKDVETEKMRICFGHNVYVCVVCNQKKMYSFKCIYCNKEFCINDGIIKSSKICKKCILLEERKEINNLICDLFDGLPNDIIEIIIDYAVGYILQCCNYNNIKDYAVECDRNIIIENKFDYYLQKKNKKFYEYCIIYFNENDTDLIPYYFMYGRYRRIFCKRCYKKEMFKCEHCQHFEWEYGENNTIKEVKSSFICGKHRFCKICGDRHGVNFVYCRKCKNNFCIKKKHSDNVINGVCRECILKTYSNSVKRALRYYLKHILTDNNQIVALIVDYAVDIYDAIKLL
eukprot:1012_1